MILTRIWKILERFYIGKVIKSQNASRSITTHPHTHTMFELGLTFSDQRHSTVAPCEKFLLEMVVPYTFDANFFISDTEEEDQGMVQTTYVAAIAAKDALSSRIHDRHDSAWWFAHGLALNAIKSSQMGSLVDDEGIASHTTSAIPTIPNM